MHLWRFNRTFSKAGAGSVSLSSGPYFPIRLLLVVPYKEDRRRLYRSLMKMSDLQQHYETKEHRGCTHRGLPEPAYWNNRPVI